MPEDQRTYHANSATVELEVALSGVLGGGRCTVIGSDLTREYVVVNADYHS